jgi:hypothetical protein
MNFFHKATLLKFSFAILIVPLRGSWAFAVYFCFPGLRSKLGLYSGNAKKRRQKVHISLANGQRGSGFSVLASSK